MGADIHLFVERLLPSGRWVPVLPPIPDGKSFPTMRGNVEWHFASFVHYDMTETEYLFWQIKQSEDSPEVPAVRWAFMRNYLAFGQLAGVRTDSLIYTFPDQCDIPKDVCSAIWKEFWVLPNPDYQFHWQTESVERDGQTYFRCPDWHTPKWLSLEDLENPDDPDAIRSTIAKPIISLIKTLNVEARKFDLVSDKDIRIVFFFDN